jgi:hypothetical protein
MAALPEIHSVRNLHDTAQTVTLQMGSLLHHLAHTSEGCTALRLVPPQGEAFKVRQDRASDVIDRSHLKLEGCDLPSTRGSGHRQRTPADPEAASDPFSLSESENDGLTSRPVRKLRSDGKEMQTHLSPSVRPVTYHGSSATATP